MPRSKTVCVDASLVVRAVIDADNVDAVALVEHWLGDRTPLVAPYLLLYDVTNALYRYALGGHRSNVIVTEALRVSRALPIRLFTGADLHQEAVTFAERFSLRAAYDAHYPTLANRLGAEFWTADKRLANAVRPELSWVRLLGE